MCKKVVICLVIYVALASSSFGDVVTLQNGLNGYSGTVDAFLRNYDKNMGEAITSGVQWCEAGGVPWGSDPAPCLMKFDNIAASLPTGVTGSNILSAKLRFYVYTPYLTGYVTAFGMTSGWTEGTGNYSNPLNGESTGLVRHYRSDGAYAAHPEDTWGNTGSQSPTNNIGPVSGVDFESPSSRTATIPSASNTWVEFNVTDLVTRWVDGTLANNGVYMYSSAYAPYVKFYSSEYTGDPNLRPELVIDYIEPNSVVLQDGFEGYSGTNDLQLGNYNSNQGANDYKVGGVPWGSNPSPGLIKFDNIVASLPVGVTADYIAEAKMRLYAFAVNQINPGTEIRVYQMDTDWTEGAGMATNAEGWSTAWYRHWRADGLYAAHPEDTWGNTGIRNTMNGPVENVDYVPNMIATASIPPSANVWMEWDITSLVKDWVSGAKINNGMYMYSTGYDPFASFRQSEYTTQSLRPALVIKYKLPVCGVDMNYPAGDIGGPDGVPDCHVDMYDMKAIAQTWLGCTTPNSVGCTQQQGVQYVIPQGTVAVDGNLDNDWTNAQWIPLDKVYSSSYPNVNNFDHAEFALQWNITTKKIYAAVKVLYKTSDYTLENSPAGWDTSDRIEVYSQGSATSGTGWGASPFNYDIAQQYNIGAGPTAGTAWAAWGSGDYIGSDAEFEYAISRSGLQFVYEIGVKQFDNYGGWSGAPTVVSNLVAGKTVGFDIIADTKPAAGFGMLSENTMSGKYNDAGKFQKYVLRNVGDCGLWGYLPTDLNQDCQVNFGDFAKIGQNWLYCNDPLDPECE